MSSADESEEFFSVHGSPPPYSLQSKLEEVFETTWNDYYAWAPPRTLPLRTTVLPQIRASEDVQVDALRATVARAKQGREKLNGSSAQSYNVQHGFAGASMLEKVPRLRTNTSTAWIRYGALPRNGGRDTSRSASVATASSAPSSSTSTLYPSLTRTITKPGVDAHRWTSHNHPNSGPVRSVPAYSFCQFTNENIWNHGSERQAFVPTFADDIVFDEVKYEALFRLKPEWEEQDRDPDIDVILVETLRRLREEKKHGQDSTSLQKLNVSDEAIDATRVLPQPCSVIGSHELTRTMPAFPDQPSVDAMMNPDLRMWTLGPEVTDTEQAERGAVADWMELACPAESCERFCCPLHVRDGRVHVMRRRQGRPQIAPLSASVAKARPSQACSGDCFVDLPRSAPQYEGDGWRVEGRDATPHWSSVEHRRLAKVLERRLGDPETRALPCHIRLLFPGTSCANVARTIVKAVVDAEERARKLPSTSSAIVVTGAAKFNLNANELQTTYRCNHKGPCVKGICRCADHQTFCETQCMCDETCKRRFRGCSCRHLNSREPCHSEKCECIKAQRECDPSVCAQCGAADVLRSGQVPSGRLDASGTWTRQPSPGPENSRYKCRNVSLQRGKAAKVRVDQSSVAGYGLFAAEDIEKWDTIGEYVGELIPNRESNRRDMLYKVTGRNYLFDLTQDRLVDAAHVGNLTRFINGERVNANCGVKIVHVLGDHRIRIFANRRIRKHEELFIDYGDAFEPNSPKKKDSMKKRKRPPPLLLGSPSAVLTVSALAKRRWTSDSGRMTDSTLTELDEETPQAKRRRFGSRLDSESSDGEFIPPGSPASRLLRLQASRSTRSGSWLSKT